MAAQETDWRRLFDRKFRPAFREIEYLKNKIHLKEGLLIFRSHIYTVDELLKSEHCDKIDSIAEKIGDDAINWYKRGEMSELGKGIYEEKRYDTEEALHLVKVEIQTRKSTWWEQSSKAFIGFVQLVMDKLPIPVRTKLEGVMAELALIPLIGIAAKLFLPPAKDIS